jgi:hypothetical protein
MTKSQRAITARKEHTMKRKGTCMVAGMMWLVLLLGITAAPGLAQQPAQPGQTASEPPAAETVEQEVQLTRTAIQIERQALVTQAMDLTPLEMEGFWPVYRDYRLDMTKVGDKLVALIVDYAASYEDLSDAVADKLLTDFVSFEKQRAAVKAKYAPKFKKVLPAKKVVRFYQVENKLDMILLREISQHIPLAR